MSGKHRKPNIDQAETALPTAFAKEIVLAIDMDHPLLEDTLPLVLHARHLPGKNHDSQHEVKDGRK